MSQRKKMSLQELRSLYGLGYNYLPGVDNRLTPATKKGHIHVVNPAAKPSPAGILSMAEYRRRSKKRNRIMKERRKSHK